MAVCCFADVLAGVQVGDDVLINGRFEADQAEVPPFWIAKKESNIRLGVSDGPEGIPTVTFWGTKDNPSNPSLRQEGLKLAASGRYRLSALVRTRGFSSEMPYIAVLGDDGRVDDERIREFPHDTTGRWVRLEREFTCARKSAISHEVVIASGRCSGEISLADVRLVALDEVAAKGTEMPEVLSVQKSPKLIPYKPLLWKIPADCRAMTFRFFGELPEGGFADYEAWLETAAGRTNAPLCAEDISLPIPAGEDTGRMTVSIVRRRGGHAVFSQAYNYCVVESPKVSEEKHRRLNNLATEVLSTELGAVSAFPFDLVRDTWVFVRFDGLASKEADALLDGKMAVHLTGPRMEFFRHLPSGTHTLEIVGCSSGRVTVRAIAEILNYPPLTNSLVPENPAYDRAFHDKYVMNAVTTLDGGRRDLVSKNSDIRALGWRWLSNKSMKAKDVDGVHQLLGKTLTGCGADYDGVTYDELILWKPAQIDCYTRGLLAYDLEHAPEKLIYTWTVGKPAIRSQDHAFFAAAVNASRGNGRIALEAYCREGKSEDVAQKYLRGYIGGTIDKYREWYPLSVPATLVVLGNFNQIPIISLATLPEVDYKYYLDMQMNFIANDPSCRGIGGVGYWGSYYADEELHRWSFALMRHYVIEGRKEMLSGRFGYTYLPGHLENGDFRNGLSSWRTTGTVTVDHVRGLGTRTEGRWGGQGSAGDSFAVLSATVGSPAAIYQDIRGLEAGRRYCLQFAAFAPDAAESEGMSDRVDVGVRFSENVRVDEGLSWVHVDRRDKKPGTKTGKINLRHIVFTADGADARLMIASLSQKVGVNCVSINPYFGRDEQDRYKKEMEATK